MRAIAKMRHDFCSRRYLPSNETIVNVLLRDRDLHFQGQTFLLILYLLLKIQVSMLDRLQPTSSLAHLPAF